ncbi:MAG: hypothetical protein RSB18_06530, partial [Clostridia bacterium]
RGVGDGQFDRVDFLLACLWLWRIDRKRQEDRGQELKLAFTENGDVIIAVFCISIFHSHDDYDHVGCGSHDATTPKTTTATMAAGAWLQHN